MTGYVALGRDLIRTILLVCLILLPGANALADDDEMTAETRACLKCHDKKGEDKILANGEKMSLHVSRQAFVESMHGETDCEDCHLDIDAATHGKKKIAIESRRAYALGMRDTCRDCHKKNVKAYEDGIHAVQVSEGNDKAPLCSDCHAAHTLRSVKAPVQLESMSCAKCHEKIFQAYAKDVHGLKRGAKNAKAPICADCHRTHDIKAASFGNGVRDACLSCHKGVVTEHKDWLPNAARHFAAISCPVCHAPTAQRRVNLRLYDGATNLPLVEKAGVPQFARRANAAAAGAEGLDGHALVSLIDEFNRDVEGGNIVLSGRLEVRHGIDAHRLSEKAKAIKDCDTCHKKGAEPFQSVQLSIAGPGGKALRHEVRSDALNSLLSTQAVQGFYAIGGTRIKSLDIALVVVVLGSIGGPLLHLVVKWSFRRSRRAQPTEQRDGDGVETSGRQE